MPRNLATPADDGIVEGVETGFCLCPLDIMCRLKYITPSALKSLLRRYSVLSFTTKVDM